MNEIRHEFVIFAPGNQVSDALTSGDHIKNWWTTNANLKPVPGEVGIFQWIPYGWNVKIKLVNAELGCFVKWLCIESNMQNTDAWVGTEMNFQIKPQGSGSRLSFTHSGYKDSPCKEICTDGCPVSHKWTGFRGVKSHLNGPA